MVASVGNMNQSLLNIAPALRARTEELEHVNALLKEEIGERKQAEEKLMESEEKFRSQYLGIPVPTYTWQKSGDDFILIDHNNAAEEFTGGGIKNFLGQKLSIMYKDDPEVVADFVECFENQSVVRKSMPYVLRSTGELKHLITSYVFVPSEYVMIHTEDITERKQAEEKLVEEKE